MDRNSKILHDINLKTQKGLELGPLTSPVVAKEHGNVRYLDHMSRAELRKKYKDEPVDLDAIVPIDYVLSKNGLEASVDGEKFDYVVASHVIEHIPDMAGWLKEVATVLKPGGVLSLAIPDKRFTFDINRQVSTPSQIIGAYIDGLKKPTSAMLYDFAVEYVDKVDSTKAFVDPTYYLKTGKKHRWTEEEAYNMCQKNKKPSEYIDCHCLVFTPASFVSAIKGLISLGLFDYEICYFAETRECELEFYASLRKINNSRVNTKQQLRSLPKVTERDKEAEQLSEIIQLKQEIEALKTSISWRLTKPARTLRGLAK
jgi:2-polyprenyl-3-methyl-5-hydroxy-6-metoxy-1,4-benzoquinol methylase